MKNLMYISSLLLITISIFLLIEYPNSNRTSLISGFFLSIGFMLNLASYLISHSLTSRHFQFFVKNIPIKEQADKV